MSVVVMALTEFAAKRREQQRFLEETLHPFVDDALDDFTAGEQDWYDTLLDRVAGEFVRVYRESGGEGYPRGVAGFLTQVRATLDKTEKVSEYTDDRVATWLGTAILNSATMAAADADDEFIVMEWVTMHDDAVRDAHEKTAGQQRPPGEPFNVDGVAMRYPGDPTAPPELWMNCRCALAPAMPDSEFATTFVSEKPWNGSASRFSPEQWKKSTILHVCDGMEKSCHKLPIREPSGVLSRAGVHAAAARFNQVQAPAEAKASAKSQLRGAYKQLGEDPPDAIKAALTMADMNEPDVCNPDSPDYDEEACAAKDQKKAPPFPTKADDENVEPMGLIPWHGVLAPEGIRSGDGRRFMENSLTFRPLPLPLTWQKASSDGHGGSVTVARIDRIWRHESEMRADGVFLATTEADEVCGLLAEFGKFGVSVDADDTIMELSEEDETIDFSQARIASASIVAIPAFAEAWVAMGQWAEEDQPTDTEILDETTEVPDELVAASFIPEGKRGPGWITNPVETKRIHDYWTRPGEEGYIKIAWGVGGDFNRCRTLVGEKIAANSPEDLIYLNQICAQWHHDALGIWPGEHLSAKDTLPFDMEKTGGPSVVLTAAAAPTLPGKWFTNPGLTAPTPLTITEEGRLFGHLAGWDTCHIAEPEGPGVCTAPPMSTTDYAYFHLGEVITTEGPVNVGQISLGGGHARDGMSSRAAAAHYDSTSTAVADICVGEDEFGIWFAGAVRPGITEDQIAELRGAKLSGDWRRIGHGLELVAALAVNVPGFPVPRTSLAASGGVQTSLVAAGIIEDTQPDPLFDTEAFAEAVVRALDRREERRKKMAALAAHVQEVTV